MRRKKKIPIASGINKVSPGSPKPLFTDPHIIPPPPPKPFRDSPPQEIDDEQANNRTLDEKRCEKICIQAPTFYTSMIPPPFSSPFLVHHCEFQERSLHLRHREQRDLLQFVRLLKPGRNGFGIVRVGVRGLLPL